MIPQKYTTLLVSTILPLAVFALVCFFSFYRLSESPPVWFDEGIYSQVAENIALHGTDALQIAPQTFVSAWSVNAGFSFIGPIALSYKFFGVGVLQGRVVMAFIIIFCSIAFYVLIRRLHGASMALLALALCATFSALYGDGKNVLGEVPGLLYMTLFLLLLNKIEQEHFHSRLWLFFAAGLCAGLCVVTKPLFLVLLGAVGIMGLLRIRTIPWAPAWLTAATLGLILPLIIHITTHLLGAGASSLASYYANPYAEGSLISTVLQNTLRFFKELSPLYCGLVFGVWALSIGVRAYRKIPVPLAEGIAFSFSTLVLLFYLRTAGWYRYFFTANMLALLFFPSALASICSAISVQNKYQKILLRSIPYVLVGILICIQGYRLVYTSWVAVHNASTDTAQLQADIGSLGDTKSIFFLNAPAMAVFAPHNPYYQYLTPAPGLEYGASELPLLMQGVPDVVALRQDEETLYATYLTRYMPLSAPGDYALYIRRP